MAASELDAADTVAITNLFREDGEDDDPTDVATIGPHNKPSGTQATSRNTMYMKI